MFGLLRFFRGICGVVFAMQIIQILEAIFWLAKPEATGVDMGKFIVLVLLKLVSLGVFGFLFFWLRGIINRRHLQKYGNPHPALAENKWAL